MNLARMLKPILTSTIPIRSWFSLFGFSCQSETLGNFLITQKINPFVPNPGRIHAFEFCTIKLHEFPFRRFSSFRRVSAMRSSSVIRHLRSNTEVVWDHSVFPTSNSEEWMRCDRFHQPKDGYPKAA
jgi:hypothetical protein